jgi:hypothetical protein
MLTVALVVLALVGFVAFSLAMVSRDSEVAAHIFSDEGFIRFRVISTVIGVSAFLADGFLLLQHLRMRRTTNGGQAA